MTFLLTKTVLKEFLQCPKYARWHINDKEKYKYIQSELYGSMDMARIGQEIEDLYMSQYTEYTAISSPFDYDETRQAIDRWDCVIYQPAFLVGSLYTRCDALVKNISWSYDLVEIKSKSTVRSKSQKAPLHEDLLYDLSFQKYVLEQALWSKFSGEVVLVYVNKMYVKDWMIDIASLLLQENCSHELLPASEISPLVSNLVHDLSLDETSFDVSYPYAGENPLLAFAHKMPVDSIFSIKSWYRIKSLVVDRYLQWKKNISDLTSEDIQAVCDYNGAGKNIALYIRRMQANIPIIETWLIQSALSGLTFPLCFYDYETISTPSPLFDWYHPWQQIVVQYSMHIVYADGSIEHRQTIIDPWSQDNGCVINSFVRDIDQWYGTYIVRNKSFENGRNAEISAIFPKYAPIFSRIHAATFDLMDIFKNDLYFHPLFSGSASIKKVLPVLTDISYAPLAIWDGASAADMLQKLVRWSLPASDIPQQLDNLTRYCSLDTRAMVVIRQKLCSL